MNLLTKIGAVLVTNAKTAYSETKELVKSSAAARLESIMKFAEPHDALGKLVPAPMPVQEVTSPTDPLAELRVQAEQGDVDAQYSLGNAYYIGYGVVKDKLEAVKWWRKAAEHGLADAQSCLGNAYKYGIGVGQDLVEADKWYALAGGLK